MQHYRIICSYRYDSNLTLQVALLHDTWYHISKHSQQIPRLISCILTKAFTQSIIVYNKYHLHFYEWSWLKRRIWGWSDHFVYAPSQCNVISHWVGAYTKQSLGCSAFFSCPPPDHRHPLRGLFHKSYTQQLNEQWNEKSYSSWIIDLKIYLVHSKTFIYHYNDVIMGAMASQITSLTIVYSTVYSGAGQRKHQSSASLIYHFMSLLYFDLMCSNPQ